MDNSKNKFKIAVDLMGGDDSQIKPSRNNIYLQRDKKETMTIFFIFMEIKI